MADEEQVSIELPGDLGDIVSFFSKYNLNKEDRWTGEKCIYLHAAGCSTPMGDGKSYLLRADGIVLLRGDKSAVDAHYESYMKHLGMLPETLKADAKAEAAQEPVVR
jgi:hypothetical protein